MEEIIEQLRKEKETLLIWINKIDNAIDSLEYLDREEDPIKQSRENVKLTDLIPKVKSKKFKNSARGPYKKKDKRGYNKGAGSKWTEEIFEFIRRNLDKKNGEIVKLLKKEMNFETKEGNLAFYMSREGIKRHGNEIEKNIKVKKGKDHNRIYVEDKPKDIRKLQKEYEEEKFEPEESDLDLDE